MTTHGSFLRHFAFRLFILLIVGSAFASCKMSNSLTDQGIIQKRKYQKGYHVNVKTPFEFQKEDVNKIDLNDQRCTASVRTEMRTASKGAKLLYPKTESPDLTLADKNLVAKSDIVTQEPDLDEKVEASINAAPILKSKSVFKTYPSVNESVNHSNQFPQQPDYYSAKRLNTLALLSFIFGVLSLFILGLPLGIAAVVCGMIALIQMEKNPTVYKGKGFAIVGLVIGLIAVVIMIAYLSAL